MSIRPRIEALPHGRLGSGQADAYLQAWLAEGFSRTDRNISNGSSLSSESPNLQAYAPRALPGVSGARRKIYLEMTTAYEGFRPRTVGPLTRFAQSLAGLGCARGLVIAAAVILAASSTLPSWSAVPVDFETDGQLGRDASAEERAALEVQLARQSNLSSEERRRVARAISEEAADAKLDPVFVLAVMGVESELDRDAVSNRGAKGLMQVRDATALFLAEKEQLGLGPGEIGDPALNVRVGVRYLSRLHRAFGDLSLALVAYNAGPHRLSGFLQTGGIPERLLAYPRKVNAHYQRLVSELDESSLRVEHPLHLRIAAR